MGARPSGFVQDKVVVGPTRVWSEQQEDIFAWFEGRHAPDCPSACNDVGELINGYRDWGCKCKHLVVRARAGTGKTSVIVEGVNRAPESSILVCAFNKRIAEELNSRITNGAAEAKTLHGLGYGYIRRRWRGMLVSSGSKRADALTEAVCAQSTPKPIKRLVSLLHTKAREMYPLGADLSTLVNLALFCDYVPDEGYSDWTVERVAEAAGLAVARAGTVEPTYDIGIDFADMIYLPLAYNLLTHDYDMVVVDECQDMSGAQLTMAQLVCSGRICVVGDDRQAIYSWRGADSASIDRLKRELGAEELPLTTTYRCPQSVVRRAQQWVPDIQAGAGNPEGVVDHYNYEGMLRDAQPGNFILSRLNAPLVSCTLHLLKQGKRARMAGRDIGQGIKNLLNKLVKYESINLVALSDRLDSWESKAVTKFASYGQGALVDRTRDQASMVRYFMEDAESVNDLMNRVDWLFTDSPDEGEVLCSSIHKAKGLEAERVYILQESLYRRGWSLEEDNCAYVATTRSKSHLSLVEGVPSL